MDSYQLEKPRPTNNAVVFGVLQTWNNFAEMNAGGALLKQSPEILRKGLEYGSEI